MDTTEQLHFDFSLSCIGEGNGNLCSCLENPRDGGAWWAAVFGVTQSWTYKVTSMLASLRKVEGWWQAKGIRSMNTLKEARAGKGPIWVMQMWANLPAGGVDRNKIDQQPSTMLLELWRQLRPEQQFTKCGKHPQKEIHVVYLEEYMVPMDVASHVLFHFEWGSGQCANLKSPGRTKGPM